MIERNLSPILLERATQYPVVTVTGPRQSGKTTLCRAAFPKHKYVSLEPLDTRSYATEDPRGFLREHSHGAILDEIQHVPGLLSYLQVEVDERPEPGRFVLTGSQHFGIGQQISQSLAGRAAVLALLPPTLDELRRFDAPFDDLWSVLCSGAFPRIHDRGIPAHTWLGDYETTYVQRDVRQLLNVGDLGSFTTFLRLCAGRSAQEVNLSSLAADTGVVTNTARAWLSVLEQSYLVIRIPSWHTNHRKQVVKAPKLHFIDTGLLCHLLGIHEPGQLVHHPLRGAIFESWVVSEIFKAQVHSGQVPRLFHYREARGPEVDCIVEQATSLRLVEAKSAATVSEHFFEPLRKLSGHLQGLAGVTDVSCFLVHGGQTSQHRTDVEVLDWSHLHDAGW
ncbi:MAG: ATP-binding protein [Pseudomonadota bacterium]